MINKENTLKTAQSLVRQYNLPLKLLGVEEGAEEVTIYFTAKKRPKLRELARELEFQLNLPIRLERINKSEVGKLGGIDILGKYPCCAPFLRKCPFGGKFGCGYGFDKVSKYQSIKASQVDEGLADRKPAEPAKTPKQGKKRKKKMVRRLVIKG